MSASCSKWLCQDTPGECIKLSRSLESRHKSAACLLISLSNLEASLGLSVNVADFLSCADAGSAQNMAKIARAIGFINAAVILYLRPVPSLLATQSGNQIAEIELCLNLCLRIESSVKSHVRKAYRLLDGGDVGRCQRIV